MSVYVGNKNELGMHWPGYRILVHVHLAELSCTE